MVAVPIEGCDGAELADRLGRRSLQKQEKERRVSQDLSILRTWGAAVLRPYENVEPKMGGVAPIKKKRLAIRREALFCG